MTTEQIWAAIAVGLLAVAVQFIKLAGDLLNDLLRSRSKKVSAKIEGEAVDVQSRTETERMGIQYMQTLVKDNAELRDESKQSAVRIAKLEEQIRLREETLTQVTKTREEQLATQSDLKVEAIRRATEMEQRAIRAEELLASTQKSFNDCMTQSGQVSADLAKLMGQYTELHKDLEERRQDWHQERNTWQVLDGARQTEVQRARFVMRMVDSKLTQDQLTFITQSCAAKGFDYHRFVEVAGSLEMAELEDLRKKNKELEDKLAAIATPQAPQVLIQTSSDTSAAP